MILRSRQKMPSKQENQICLFFVKKTKQITICQMIGSSDTTRSKVKR